MEVLQQTKPQMIAKFFINDLKGILKRKGLESDDKASRVLEYLMLDGNLHLMFDMLYDGDIDRQTMKLWVMESCDTFNAIENFLEYVKDYGKVAP
jgi:hypothetical protein